MWFDLGSDASLVVEVVTVRVVTVPVPSMTELGALFFADVPAPEKINGQRAHSTEQRVLMAQGPHVLHPPIFVRLAIV